MTTTRFSESTRAACAAAWDGILAGIESGQTVKAACAEYGLHDAVVRAFKRESPERVAQWESARRDSAASFEERILEQIEVPTGDAQYARVRVDAWKWIAAKRYPDAYSERTRVDVRQTVDYAGILTRAEARLAQMRAAALGAEDAEVVQTLALSDVVTSGAK